jgi:hypothetical protein
MFYYLLSYYNIDDLCFDEQTDLRGPFNSEDERADALNDEAIDMDIETAVLVNCTFLKISNNKLEKETSFLVNGKK